MMFSFGDLPDHVQAQLIAQQEAHQKEHDMAEMNQLAAEADIQQFVNRLNLADLKTLRTIVMVSGREPMNTMLYGIITGTMVQKYETNWTGDRPEDLTGDTDDVESDLSREEQKEQRVGLYRVEDPVEPVKSDHVRDTSPRGEEFPDPSTPYVGPDGDVANETISGPDYEAELMRRYNVKKAVDGSLSCSGCGNFIHSLEDRMLREEGTGGCPTCQHKTKWG